MWASQTSAICVAVSASTSTHHTQRDWQHICVHHVIAGGSKDRPAQVSERRQIGCEKEEHEREPAVVSVEVEDESCDRDREPFEAQESGGKSRDHQIAP